jgi:hypothetical protein
MSEFYDVEEGCSPSRSLDHQVAQRWAVMKKALPDLHLRELVTEFLDIVHYYPAVNRAQHVFDGGDKAPAHHELAVVVCEVYRHQSDGSEKRTCCRVHVTMNEKAAFRAHGCIWGDWILTGQNLDYDQGSE